MELGFWNHGRQNPDALAVIGPLATAHTGNPQENRAKRAPYNISRLSRRKVQRIGRFKQESIPVKSQHLSHSAYYIANIAQKCKYFLRLK